MKSGFVGQGVSAKSQKVNDFSAITKKARKAASYDAITVKKVRAFNNHLFKKKKLWCPEKSKLVSQDVNNELYGASNDNDKTPLQLFIQSWAKSMSYAFKFLTYISLGLVR